MITYCFKKFVEYKYSLTKKEQLALDQTLNIFINIDEAWSVIENFLSVGDDSILGGTNKILKNFNEKIKELLAFN